MQAPPREERGKREAPPRLPPSPPLLPTKPHFVLFLFSVKAHVTRRRKNALLPPLSLSLQYSPLLLPPSSFFCLPHHKLHSAAEEEQEEGGRG